MKGEWLRQGTVLPDQERLSSLYVAGEHWQIWLTAGGGQALLVTGTLFRQWLQRSLIEDGLMMPVQAGWGICYEISVDRDGWISSADNGPYPVTTAEVMGFARALQAACRRQDVPLADGLYISTLPLVLPGSFSGKSEDPDRILGKWICAGMHISVTDRDRMSRYAYWLPQTCRQTLLDMFSLREQEPGDGEDRLTMPSPPAYGKGEEGLSWTDSAPDVQQITERKPRKEGPFRLAGRQELEKFFREDILDVIDREEEYQRFGVGFPGATLLYGPSGSGKTFAVEKLADYLGWPVLRVTSGTIGSKWVHETSRKISEVFDEAIRAAPSILIIDEMEAFLSDREDYFGSRGIHMEEMAEFLRRIPDAPKNHVLLFGMTNMLKSIDPAILRKGRFDHVLEVGMPSKEEVLAVLTEALKDLPSEGSLPLDRLAEELAGRPLSDVTFVVSEAGKNSVRANKKGIDAGALFEAAARLAPKKKKESRIGFFA